MNTKTIVESVLTPVVSEKLWSANYLPVLPFTPQSFEVGSLLPAMLYMARWGHRRGKGHFSSTFARPDARYPAPRLVDVASGLLTRTASGFDGFSADHGTAMLADLLLTYCLENKDHALGHEVAVTRVFPTHYLASWLDLPKEVGHLRGVPELLTVLLAWQPQGASLAQYSGGDFPVAAGRDSFHKNPLLALFGHYMRIEGPDANLSSDCFQEPLADGLGIDELLAVRLALTCQHAPDKLAGGIRAAIPNRWPLAQTAARTLSEDLATFIKTYGSILPRQALLPMLEAGIGLGMSNVLFSTTVLMAEWERTGVVSPNPSPLPLWVDCSHGLEPKLRDLAETALSEALSRYQRLPVQMMLARLLEVLADDEGITNPKAQGPDASAWLNILGKIYTQGHPQAKDIHRDVSKHCKRLADALAQAEEAPEVVQALRNPALNPLLRLAEALVELHGQQQQGGQYLKALDSSLMPNRPNGLVMKRRVSRSSAGVKKMLDLRAVVLSQALLDFLVHRYLPQGNARPLTLRRFLDVLRERYGLYVDREPPGMSVPQELLRVNKHYLERHLRDLGLLVGVNDAESMKQLRPRFKAPTTADTALTGRTTTPGIGDNLS